jgi:hypothetical protein
MKETSLTGKAAYKIKIRKIYKRLDLLVEPETQSKTENLL